ncbi:glutathione synthase [Candidatus Pacearchaeota archaeon]|nr:glutathione synthase [Candidatus Pacearchaeota archaeon]
MEKPLRIGVVLNDVLKLKVSDTVINKVGVAAVNRGHKMFFMGVGDFSYDGDEKVYSKVVIIPEKKYSSSENLVKDIHSLANEKTQKICVSDLDILLLRFDPSIEPPERAWARTIALDYGALATKHGVLVLNNPGGLSKSRNKMYLQHFPEEIRPQTIITRNRDDIKKLFQEHGKVVLKPLSGSEGRNVFLVNEKEIPNINQMIDAVSRDDYVIAQEYLPEAEEGDIRVFLMNGEPLVKNGVYAAFKRVRTGGDLRTNISAGGKPKKAKITKEILRICDIVRPRLIQDGMFLVGLDIVGNKLIEINVFCPGGFENIQKVTGIDFSDSVVDALERKVEYKNYYKGKFDNNEMATL